MKFAVGDKITRIDGKVGVGIIEDVHQYDKETLIYSIMWPGMRIAVGYQADDIHKDWEVNNDSRTYWSEDVAKLINHAITEADNDFFSHMALTKLLDGISTYQLTISGEKWEFVDFEGEDPVEDACEQCYAKIKQVKNQRRADAVMKVLGYEV